MSPRYFKLDWSTPTRVERHSFQVEYPTRGIRWHSGLRLSQSEDDEELQPPKTPIEVVVEKTTGALRHVYPEYASDPIPLMSRRLVAALLGAGVTTLQAYETRLVTASGGTAPDHYWAVNVVGNVKASALEKTAPRKADLAQKMVALEVLAQRARLFRYDTDSLLVPEEVRAQVIESGIDTLYWVAPEEWAR